MYMDKHTCWGSYQLYLCAGMAHVADYAAILHFVQMFPPNHIFIAFRIEQNRMEENFIVHHGEALSDTQLYYYLHNN